MADLKKSWKTSTNLEDFHCWISKLTAKATIIQPETVRDKHKCVCVCVYKYMCVYTPININIYSGKIKTFWALKYICKNE
jgi:hypothetical protein